MSVEAVTIGAATLYLGDCREVVPTLAQVDSVVCDPPYHLGPQRSQEIGWPSWTANTQQSRAKAGFMGQQWDGGDISFRPETWAVIGSVLRPGGFLLAFGGTRTWHRLACAIEDAGFVLQDTIAWIYGTGFPKGKALLKPAFEPIIMAYKPGGKRELSIDECLIGATVETWPKSRSYIPHHKQPGGDTGGHVQRTGDAPLGRWPANLCHDGSDEVLTLFPQSAGQQGRVTGLEPSVRTRHIYGDGLDRQASSPRGDAGSAARFFYCAKAGKADRAGSKHPTVKPQALMRWLVSLVTPPGGTTLDPFGGSGSTAQAALAVGRRPIIIEREQEWFADIRRRIEAAQAQEQMAI